MPDVKQVEASVGQRQTGVVLTLPIQKGDEFLGGDDARIHDLSDRSFVPNSS